jgi:hypothetical protein
MLKDFSPESSYRVDTSFWGGFLCILLAHFNKTQVLPKNAVNPKGLKNQKTGAQ